MITIPKSNWYIILGEKKPHIECPDCGGQLLGESAPHGVKENGEVFNSVVCPCGFHQYVKLEGWQNGPVAHR